jgi:competence protein ComGC
MLRNQKGISIYGIISIIAFLALIFILALPSMFNLNEKENENLCIKQQEQLYKAIKQYMIDRGADFNGDAVELKRTGYLNATFECPENGVGDKYQMSGVFNNGEPVISISCPNTGEFPGHVIPEAYLIRN